MESSGGRSSRPVSGEDRPLLGGLAGSENMGSVGSVTHSSHEEQHWWARGLLTRPRLVVDWDETMTKGELTEEFDSRKVTWTELLFDLACVTVIAKLGESYREGIEHGNEDAWLVLAAYAIKFFLLWGIWVTYAQYSTFFHTDDLLNKVFTIIIMFGVVLLGMHAKHEAGEILISDQFIYANIFSALVFLAPIAHVMYHIKRLHKFFKAWIVGTLSFVVGLLLVMYLCPRKYQWLCYGIVQMASSWLQMCFLITLNKHERIPLHLEHYVERFGLIIVICIGECITGVTIEPGKDDGYLLYAVVFLSLVCVLNMKMLYFDVDIIEEEEHALRTNAFRGFLWSKLHAVFALAIATIGSSMEVMLSSYEPQLVTISRKTLCVSSFVFLAVLLINRFLHRSTSACLELLEDKDKCNACCFSADKKLRYMFWMKVVYHVQIWLHVVVAIITGLSGFVPEEILSNTALIALGALNTSLLVFVNLLDEALSVGFLEK